MKDAGMSYIQGVDQNQIILLPDTFDDYVSGDNEVRAIDAFIHSLVISLMGFKEDPAKEDIAEVLDYLERCKAQLTEALEQMAGSGENHICTTDPESRLMKTRDGIWPSLNVQTAVEPENHLIVYYDVTSECTDWHLLGNGINTSKAALGMENLEGIADRGYSNDEEILQCLLNGDTPTTHPNMGEKSRLFRFQKTDAEVTEETLSSKDRNTLLACISAGVLPGILQRGNVGLEVVKRREQESSLYQDKETGEVVSYAEMKAQGGLETALVEVRREPPLHPYFERDIENDIVICSMGQTLFYAGPGHPNGKEHNRRGTGGAVFMHQDRGKAEHARQLQFRAESCGRHSRWQWMTMSCIRTHSALNWQQWW